MNDNDVEVCMDESGFSSGAGASPKREPTQNSGLRRFTMYRRGEMTAHHTDLHKNAPDEPQFEGVVLSNGKCVISWLTPINSVSVWASFDDMLAIHGHPEYGSELVWHDE